MKRIPLLFAVALSACGGVAAQDAVDAATSDDAPTGDATTANRGDAQATPPVDAAPTDSAEIDVSATSGGACDPPCAAGEYCYVQRCVCGSPAPPRHLDPLDAGAPPSPGCHPAPGGACGHPLYPSCACLLQQIGPACAEGGTLSGTATCAIDDAGRPTLTCTVVGP